MRRRQALTARRRAPGRGRAWRRSTSRAQSISQRPTAGTRSAPATRTGSTSAPDSSRSRSRCSARAQRRRHQRAAAGVLAHAVDRRDGSVQKVTRSSVAPPASDTSSQAVKTGSGRGGRRGRARAIRCGALGLVDHGLDPHPRCSGGSTRNRAAAPTPPTQALEPSSEMKSVAERLAVREVADEVEDVLARTVDDDGGGHGPMASGDSILHAAAARMTSFRVFPSPFSG